MSGANSGACARRFMTDGMLLREAVIGGFLSNRKFLIFITSCTVRRFMTGSMLLREAMRKPS